MKTYNFFGAFKLVLSSDLKCDAVESILESRGGGRINNAVRGMFYAGVASSNGFSGGFCSTASSINLVLGKSDPRR